MPTASWLGLAAACLTMTLIIFVRYLVVSGVFVWIGEKRSPGLHKGLSRQMRHEVAWSSVSSLIYALPAAIAAWGWHAHGWTKIYTDVQPRDRWWIPLSLILVLFLHDSWFYWTHRLMHHPRLFKVVHAVHHKSRPPTAWAAMAFHPLEAVTGAIFVPIIVFILPLHIAVVGAVLAIMTLMGAANHAGWEILPQSLVRGKIGNWLISATHHEVHHRFYSRNFGLYFRFWDRLMDTDGGLKRIG